MAIDLLDHNALSANLSKGFSSQALAQPGAAKMAIISLRMLG
jgi:hypothetical protein